VKPFHFKQFSITQSKDAFKIGTDALLLGGWHPQTHHPKEILDIGTGTGIVALMAAQRAPKSKVTAIELQA
jgi:tRNA1Val (adenine37-N6)-methyltransferase